jgi:hypothetical protein
MFAAWRAGSAAAGRRELVTPDVVYNDTYEPDLERPGARLRATGAPTPRATRW